MMSLEQLNLGHNMFSGMISSNICTLPNLENFVYEHNYFSEESPACLNLNAFADQQNCLRGRPMQRSALDCQRFLSNEVDCTTFKCALPPPSPPPTTPPQNNCCICFPPPSPSPLPSTEPPSSPLPLPAPSASPSPPSISPSPSPSSPQPPDLPSLSPSPSFVEPPLPSPLPCENQRIPSSQDMSSPSP
uniref:Putative ovule protein n=1 Tax=Solanum chacoense TaxID=4108 RepID=A0A0V0H918_SOLCH